MGPAAWFADTITLDVFCLCRAWLTGCVASGERVWETLLMLFVIGYCTSRLLSSTSSNGCAKLM